VRIALTGAILFLVGSRALAQEAGCALGYVYDLDTNQRLADITVHIVDGQEAKTNADGYYAIPIPPRQNVFPVFAAHRLYVPKHLPGNTRAPGHTTNCEPLGIRQSWRLSHPQLRSELSAAEQELIAARSPELRAVLRDSISTMQAAVAATRYVDRTYATTVPVISLECRRVMRPTLLGYEPVACRVPVRRCETQPVTVREPFDVDTPQEAQANAESIRLADSLLRSLQPQFATIPPAQRAF
jgi:hypothetical protein